MSRMRVFEHAVRGGVGDHQRGKIAMMLLRLGLQIADVHVAVRVGGHDDHPVPRHDGARRVGAMRRRRNQHHVAVPFAAILVIGANDGEPGEFPLRARIGLERRGGKAGNGGQRRLELAEDLLIARRLVERRERMQARELLPRHRIHFGGRVELHRARAERDHRRIEPDVLPLEASHVAHHLGFGVMRVEHRMGQVRRGAAQIRRQRRFVVERRGVDAPGAFPGRGGKDIGDRLHVLDGRRLVERDADARVAGVAEVDPRGGGALADGVDGLARGGHTKRVEVGVVLLRVAERAQLAIEQACEAVHARGDGANAGRPVIDGVHRRHVGQERLRRADVGRGLLAPDVLLARLQRHAVRGLPLRVDRHTDDAAGHVADVVFLHRKEGGVRAAVPERHTEAL